jgi:hypothetical protein
MNNNLENDINIDENWYYVIVQNPGTSAEQFVGYRDEENDLQFLPIFKTIKEAQKCFKQMPKDLFNAKYEAQAVIEDDLFKISEEQNYKLYILDGEGIVSKEL